MKRFVFLIAILFSSVLFAKGHATVYENPFSIVYGGSGTKIYGDYEVIASSVECIQASNGTCDNHYNGYLFDATTRYVNSVSTSLIPLNSSTETLSLPQDVNGSDILFAGLYWQGHIAGTNASNYNSAIIGRNQVDFIDPAGNLHHLNADNLWYHDFWGNGTGSNGGFRSFYQGFKDVTSILQNTYQTGQTNSVTVGNVKASIGADHFQYFWTTDAEYNGIKMGFYGNWNLIVVYKYPNVAVMSPRPKPKNVTVFQGFDALIPLPTNNAARTKSISIGLSGFLTPSQQPINAKLSFYGSGGEKLLNYDKLEIQHGATSSYDQISNSANPADDAFNGSVSTFGTPQDSSISYYPGLDSDTFDVSSSMDTRQTATSLRLTAQFIGNSGDQFFPGLIVFATDLYEPKFCYDYTYKQYGRYFTEENNGTQDPRLVGKSYTQANVPIDISIYVRNQIDSDLQIQNMTVDVIDINTSQAVYDTSTDSVALAKTGELTPVPISNSSLNVADSYIRNIPVGNMDANDFFYLYYSLMPQVGGTNLDMPIKVKVTYDLITAGGASLPYDVTIGNEIQMCSSGNFNYAPAKGIFNVVHSDYYDADLGGSNSYYNLPTQVAERVGNFKVLSFDPTDPSLDQLQEVNGSVTTFVEMIDAAAFHDVNASCQELSSAITDRVEVDFNNTYTEPFNASSGVSADFYRTARQNAAFRVSYNTDPNGNLLKWEGDDVNGYYLTNFPNIVNLGACKSGAVSFVPMNGAARTVTTAAAACGNNGAAPNNSASAISKSQRSACERCVYGYYTQVVCSRDNFAIRPEALLIKLNDQNQTTGSSETRIADDISGNSSPSGTVVDLAGGYNYDIEVNATNFIDNNATPGYTAFYNDMTSNQYIMLKWEPRTSVSNCNDTNDKKFSMNLYNGQLINLHDQNISMDNVGDYRLTMRDSLWTQVDWDSTYMGHHTGSHFLSGADCIVGSDIVPAGSGGALSPAVGCDITSNHDAVSGIKYRDYNVTFHPYKFDISTILSSTGLSDANATVRNFVYNNNIDDNATGVYSDLNMSYHIYGTVSAKGENGSSLTNFVTNCYAKNIDINLSRSTYADGSMTFKQSLETLDQNNTRIAIGFEDANNTKFDVSIAKTNFVKQLNGSTKVRIRYNFARDVNDSKNPQKISFGLLNVDCNTTSECTAYADLKSSYRPIDNSKKTFNDTIYFYYARAHVPKMVTNGPDGNATGYYEVYCYGAGCNKNYLQDELTGGTSANSDDPRWWINSLHTFDFGKIKSVSQKRTPAHVSVTTMPVGNAADTIGLRYDGTKGYPYRAIMKIVPDKWLIYNKYDPNADHNEFEAQFNNDTSDWIGSGETQDATETKKFGYKDRKLTW